MNDDVDSSGSSGNEYQTLHDSHSNHRLAAEVSYEETK